MDNLDTSFKLAKKKYGKNAYNFFKFGLNPNSKFIHWDHDRFDEFDLEDEFEGKYYEDDFDEFDEDDY